MKCQKACDQQLYLQDLEGEVCDWDYSEAYGGPCLVAHICILKAFNYKELQFHWYPHISGLSISKTNQYYVFVKL